MKAYLSIVNYYPDTNREEGFGIGLVLTSASDELCLVKISSERIKRINSAYALDRSKLLDFSFEEISKKIFKKKDLDYLSVYENGNIRYTKPQILETDDLEKKFSELYSKYAADYYEDGYSGNVNYIRKISARLGPALRKKFSTNKTLNSRLNIGYNFQDSDIQKFLIGNANIDFIGGNGSVFSGELINLDLNEESLQKSLNKTITLFEALDKTFSKIGRFVAKDCKLLVLKEQAFNPAKAVYMEKLNTWHDKAGYDLVIKNSMDEFESDIQTIVDEKNIVRFDTWLENISTSS